MISGIQVVEKKEDAPYEGASSLVSIVSYTRQYECSG